MKKESIFKFLLRVVLSNIASFAVYQLLLNLLNLFTGGGFAIFTGAQEWNGWNRDDLTPFLQLFIPIMLVVFYVLSFVLFYAIMVFIMQRSGGRREDFLHEIGATHFDRREFTAARMGNGGVGRRELIVFSIFMAVCYVMMFFGLGIFELLILPQIMIATAVLYFIPIVGTVRLILLIAISLATSVTAFYLYQTQLVPRIYEKWANERLRKE